MPQLRIVKRSGEEAIIDATAGHSVMEAITNSGVEDIAAICGGAALAARSRRPAHAAGPAAASRLCQDREGAA